MRMVSIGLAAWVLAAAPAHAETITLTLREAVARALSDGTAVRIAGTHMDSASARALEARSALLPQASLDVTDYNQILNLRTFGLTFPGFPTLVGPFNVFDAHVTVALKAVDLAAYRRYAAARQGIAASARETEKAENDVAAAVATIYVALQRAQASVEASRANVELFQKLKDLADDQVRAGVATRIDSTRSAVALARQRLALLVAENQRDAARLALLHTIGADQSSNVVLADALEQEGEPAPAVEAALSRAFAERPELRVFTERIKAQELLAASARAEHYPVLAGQFQGGYNGNQLNALSWNRVVAGSISMPLFDGWRAASRVAEAESQRRELVLARTETERQVEEEVRGALLAYESARSRTRVASENLELAALELDLARDRFAGGVAPSIEVDNAQTSLVTAREDRVAAMADLARARYDLWHATGQIHTLVGGSQTP